MGVVDVIYAFEKGVLSGRVKEWLGVGAENVVSSFRSEKTGKFGCLSETYEAYREESMMLLPSSQAANVRVKG
jgi:tRNA splicing endonuclease